MAFPESRLALACTALSLFVFVTWPEMDRHVSEHFYLGTQVFWADGVFWADLLYWGAPLLGQVCFVLVICGLMAHALGYYPLERKLWRTFCAWMLVVVLGVGLVVHAALKNQIGRPRPVQTLTMGGAATYVPPFVQSNACQKNCSFVSGHAAIAFSLMAIGALRGPAGRRRWLWAGCLAGMLMGAVRVLQGRHFLSDVVFAGLVVFWVQWLVRRAWILWIARRRSGGVWQALS